MLHRLFPRPFLSLTVFLLWLVIANATSAGLLVLGGVLAVAVPRVTQRFWPTPPRCRLSWWMLRLPVFFVADLITANWRVARQVIGPLHRLAPAFIEIPLELRDPFAISLLACIVSLTPGTLSIRVDRQRWVMLVHALDAPDPPAMIDTIKNRYEQPLREIFSC